MKRKMVLIGFLVIVLAVWFQSQASMQPREIKPNDPGKSGFTADEMEQVEMTLAQGRDPFVVSR